MPFMPIPTTNINAQCPLSLPLYTAEGALAAVGMESVEYMFSEGDGVIVVCAVLEDGDLGSISEIPFSVEDDTASGNSETHSISATIPKHIHSCVCSSHAPETPLSLYYCYNTTLTLQTMLYLIPITKVLQVNSLLFFFILSLPISYSQCNNSASYFITKSVQVNSILSLTPPPYPSATFLSFPYSSLPPLLLTIFLSLSDSMAICAAVDYLLPQTLVFRFPLMSPVGQPACVEFTLVNDNIVEDMRTFEIRLTPLPGVTVGTNGFAFVTIVDDDCKSTHPYPILTCVSKINVRDDGFKIIYRCDFNAAHSYYSNS